MAINRLRLFVIFDTEDLSLGSHYFGGICEGLYFSSSYVVM